MTFFADIILEAIPPPAHISVMERSEPFVDSKRETIYPFSPRQGIILSEGEENGY